MAYSRSRAKIEALAAEVLASAEPTPPAPGRMGERILWAMGIHLAALEDQVDLVTTPFAGEAKLTAAEISMFRDHIELLRWAESNYHAKRIGIAAASQAWNEVYEPAYRDKEVVLRAFSLLFRNNAEGQKRVAKIREGAGDADFVQDVSDVLHLADEHKAGLASCPRGEAEAATRLKKVSPELTKLLAQKSTTGESKKAKALRHAAYATVSRTERRIRAAADYWYRGEDRARAYLAFPQSRNTRNGFDEVPETDEAPATAPVAEPVG